MRHLHIRRNIFPSWFTLLPCNHVCRVRDQVSGLFTSGVNDDTWVLQKFLFGCLDLRSILAQEFEQYMPWPDPVHRGQPFPLIRCRSSKSGASWPWQLRLQLVPDKAGWFCLVQSPSSLLVIQSARRSVVARGSFPGTIVLGVTSCGTLPKRSFDSLGY